MNDTSEENTLPPRVLLSIYEHNRIRMKRLRFPLGMTITRWINDAIEVKLNSLNLGEPMEEPPVTTIRDPMEQRRLALRASRGVDYVGPYTVKYRGKIEYDHVLTQHKKKRSESPGIETLLEIFCEKNDAVLSPEEQKEIMDGYALEQKKLAELPPIPEHLLGHPRLIERWRDAGSPVEEAQAMEELPASVQPVQSSASPMEEDADFWGEADEAAYHRIKAKACKA